MKKIKNTFFSVKFSFSLLWKNQKTLILYVVGLELLKLINVFVLILFPKYLLDNLSNGNIDKALIIVVLFSIYSLIYSVLNTILNNKRANSSLKNNICTQTILAEKMAGLRYEQMEETENLERYEMAKKCIEKGNAELCLRNSFSIISSIIVIMGVVYVLHGMPWYITLVVLAVIAVNTVGNIVNAKYAYKEMTEETPTERKLYYLRGRLMNKEYAKEIRLFSLKNFIYKKTVEVIEDFFDINVKYEKKYNKTLVWTYIASGVQYVAVYIYNIVMLFKGRLTIGNFSMNISALFQFGTALNDVFSQTINLMEQAIYINSLKKFLEMENSNKGTEPISIEKEFEIRFENVSFSYPGSDKNALENVNVVIKSGERLSIVGENGAGKSTFIKLVLGLYKPTAGKIYFNGKDVESILPEDYNKMFAAVMQDYNIYGFSVLENIDFKENCSERERVKALDSVKLMGLEEVIGSLSEKENTYITQRYSENGIELSGGEYQRIALSRAIYRAAKIIILDEPTSALSPQNEYQIYHRFNDIVRDKTVLFISHRMSSCTICDRILVFSDGKITESGSHSELMKNNSRYKEMFEKQASMYLGGV